MEALSKCEIYTKDGREYYLWGYATDCSESDRQGAMMAIYSNTNIPNLLLTRDAYEFNETFSLKQ